MNEVHFLIEIDFCMIVLFVCSVHFALQGVMGKCVETEVQELRVLLATPKPPKQTAHPMGMGMGNPMSAAANAMNQWQPFMNPMMMGCNPLMNPMMCYPPMMNPMMFGYGPSRATFNTAAARHNPLSAANTGGKPVAPTEFASNSHYQE